MENIYVDYAKVLKALSDPNRLKIIDMLSCGEKCACEILEPFEFTQPTLSHHMKILAECGLVKIRKEGLWSHYSLNQVKCDELRDMLTRLMCDKQDCICKQTKGKD